MKEQVAKDWVAALRSGQYKQARGELRDSDGAMCCLGVLCDISGLGKWRNIGFGIYAGIGVLGQTVFRSTKGTPPLEVTLWAGLANPLGEFPNAVNYGAPSLAKMNDNGASFERIADIIDDNWEHL